MKTSPITTGRLKSLRLFSTPPKPRFFKFRRLSQKISWGKVARCCFELPALTGNLANSDRLRWPTGLLTGWTNISLSPRILEDQRCERSSTSRIELRASDNRSSGRARCWFSTSIQPLARAGNLQRLVQAGLLTQAEQQTQQDAPGEG